MMLSLYAIAAFALLDSVVAIPTAVKRKSYAVQQCNLCLTHSTAGSVPSCTDFIIPVVATAPVKLIDESLIPKNLNDPTVLVDFIVSEASSGLAALLGAAGTAETSGSFNMSARYCEPVNMDPKRATTIQYLQHAITNTKNYWNGLTYPVGQDGSMYSWIDYASNVKLLSTES